MLSAALAALRRHDVEGAIPSLLEAWRETRDPRIADALDAVSARIDRPALTAPTQKKLVEAFAALVAAGDPLDQPRLAAAIGGTRSQPMVEQLDLLLAQWPADPRFSVPFLALLRRPPFVGSATQSAWRRLFKVLQAYGDARVEEWLPALDFDEILARDGGIENRAAAAEFFRERSAATCAALRKKKRAALPAADEATLAHVLELARPAAEVALVAQVLATPADDAAKAVLGDHLLEQNDVRGRFAALQRARSEGALTAALRKEERALVDAHGLRWIGDLATLVQPGSLEFEGGFLAGCAIESDRQGAVARLTGHPLWSTVRRIFLAGNAFPETLLTHPAMKSLTQVTGIRAGHGVVRGPYPWTEVGLLVRDGAGRVALDRVEDTLRAFPAVEKAWLDAYQVDPEAYAWLFRPAWASLRSLGFLAATRSALAHWVEVLLAEAPAGVELELSEFHHHGYLFRLDGTRNVLDLRARSAWGRKIVSFGDLAAAARPLARTLTTVRLHDRATKAERATIEALLAPDGTIEVVS